MAMVQTARLRTAGRAGTTFSKREALPIAPPSHARIAQSANNWNRRNGYSCILPSVRCRPPPGMSRGVFSGGIFGERTMANDTIADNDIYSAAMQVAARIGWRKARLADIAEEAGLSLAGLHDRYDSKQALLDGLVRHIDRIVPEGRAAAERRRLVPSRPAVRYPDAALRCPQALQGRHPRHRARRRRRHCRNSVRWLPAPAVDALDAGGGGASAPPAGSAG